MARRATANSAGRGREHTSPEAVAGGVGGTAKSEPVADCEAQGMGGTGGVVGADLERARRRETMAAKFREPEVTERTARILIFVSDAVSAIFLVLSAQRRVIKRPSGS